MFKTALLCARTVRRLGGRDSDRSAAALALTLCPDLLSRLRMEGRLILVTGSDGKSTVTALCVHMLRAAGLRVITNCESSGRPADITSTLLAAADLSGRIRCDALVLEADGRSAPALPDSVSPAYLLISDLLPDHGPISCRREAVLELVERVAGQDCVLLANALDPACVALAHRHPGAVLFGAAPSPHFGTECRNLISAGGLCPACSRPLSYSFIMHHHLGGWRCPHCGLTPPRPKYCMDGLSLSEPAFTVNGVPFRAEFAAPYLYMNVTAAAALACEVLGCDCERASGLLADFRLHSGFFSEQTLDGRRIVCLLSREGNPVSFDRSLEYVTSHPETKTVLLHAGESDGSGMDNICWLYDTTFELLQRSCETVVCAGSRSRDVAARLVYAGIRRENILLCETPDRLWNTLRATRGTVYVLGEPAVCGRVLRILQKGGLA